MMKQPIQKGRGHNAVAHHLGPGFEALVGGDDDGDLLIQVADHVEKQVGLPSLDGLYPHRSPRGPSVLPTRL